MKGGKKAKSPRPQDYYYRKKKAMERKAQFASWLAQYHFIVPTDYVDKVYKIDWIFLWGSKVLPIQYRTLSIKNWDRPFIREEEVKILTDLGFVVCVFFWFDENEKLSKITACQITNETKFDVKYDKRDGYNLAFIDHDQTYDITSLNRDEFFEQFNHWWTDFETVESKIGKI